MSQEQSAKKKDRRYVGKVQTRNGKYGAMQSILIDNPEATNKDGTPNQYYTGALVWYDKDGRAFQIKQLELFVPREGMPAGLAQKGFSCNVTMDLENEYHVKELKTQG